MIDQNFKRASEGYVKPINKISIKDYFPLLKLALKEDNIDHDVTTNSIFKKSDQAKAVLLCKGSGVLCGIEIFKETFKVVDSSLKIKTNKIDGDILTKGIIVAEIEGCTRSILKAERVALNFLSMLSGISTKSRAVYEILKPYRIIPLDTRKTLPGFRMLSKYAVFIGGATNHRLNLSDMGLIKDNHIAAAGGIKNSIRIFRKNYPLLKCEIEVENEIQLCQALEEKPDMILLDNMAPGLLKRCCMIVKKFNLQNSTNITCEASGGFTIENLNKIFKTGIDYISMGSLTNNINPLDFSLEIIQKK